MTENASRILKMHCDMTPRSERKSQQNCSPASKRPRRMWRGLGPLKLFGVLPKRGLISKPPI